MSRRTTCRRLLKELQPRTIPTLHERQFKFPNLNKFFACCWVDVVSQAALCKMISLQYFAYQVNCNKTAFPYFLIFLYFLSLYNQERILLGTKCNKLINLNINTGEHFEIGRPPRPPRNVTSTYDGWGNCGIHCIAMNPSGDLIATGGTDPDDCAILRTSNWTPVATLVGHQDWLFGAAWVTDRHVVTGSRDKSVALWDINHLFPPDGSACASEIGDDERGPRIEGKTAPVIEYSYQNPHHMKRKFGGRVRDLKYEPVKGIVAALDTDGLIKCMDPRNLRVVRSVRNRSN